MIRNYITVAIRNISRYMSYALINVFGLALGMASALLIFSLVSHHLSYDTFHPETDRIFRVVTEQQRDQMDYSAAAPPALGKVIRDDLTFAEKTARAVVYHDELVYVTEDGQTNKFSQPLVCLAEHDYFEIFSIPMMNGANAGDLLDQPNSAIMTEKEAKKFFGTADALDKVFRVGTRGEFRVVGIMKNIPDNTAFRSEVYLSYINLKQFDKQLVDENAWGGIWSNFRTYVRLKPGASIVDAENAMTEQGKKFRAKARSVHQYKLQPIRDVHFNPHFEGAMNIRMIIALGVIGFLLVITACVNFVNLSTARATSRSREVGIRKVMGGVKSQILWQFMTETFIVTAISIALAMGLATSLIPWINSEFDSRLSLDFFGDWRLMVFVPLLMIFVTFVAGFYPGMILSAFQAAQALKGKMSQHKTGGLNLRRALIVAQFSISQILVIVLVVVIYQVHYSQTSDMGFKREAVLMIPVGSNDEKTKTLKSELESIPGVERVSACWSAPSSEASWNTSARFGNRDENENFSVSARLSDEDYISLFDIQLVAGRNITPSDTLREFLINERFVEKLGLTPGEVIGQNLRVNGEWKFPIVGVVKDFHDVSFHQDINPIFIGTKLDFYSTYAIRINMNDMRRTLLSIEDKWTAMYPDLIYHSEFLDDAIAHFYDTEENILKMVKIFSFIAILVGCMGLFGLVSFMSIQRTKEIGIRKVLGGSIAQILWIFGKEFSILIVVSFLLAVPLGWWLMSRWLQEYRYHIDLEAWIFVAAIVFTAVVALLTVGYRSLRAATANPVDSLRAE
jgi:putative ABC transport system permease protein